MSPATHTTTPVQQQPAPVPATLRMRVFTPYWKAAGIWPGDLLWIDPHGQPADGQLVVLQWGRQWVLRQYRHTSQGHELLAPQGATATLLWPLHQPLPLAGTVVKLERNCTPASNF